MKMGGYFNEMTGKCQVSTVITSTAKVIGVNKLYPQVHACRRKILWYWQCIRVYTHSTRVFQYNNTVVSFVAVHHSSWRIRTTNYYVKSLTAVCSWLFRKTSLEGINLQYKVLFLLCELRNFLFNFSLRLLRVDEYVVALHFESLVNWTLEQRLFTLLVTFKHLLTTLTDNSWVSSLSLRAASSTVTWVLSLEASKSEGSPLKLVLRGVAGSLSRFLSAVSSSCATCSISWSLCWERRKRRRWKEKKTVYKCTLQDGLLRVAAHYAHAYLQRLCLCKTICCADF